MSKISPPFLKLQSKKKKNKSSNSFEIEKVKGDLMR